MGTCASYCLSIMEKEIEIHKDYIKSPIRKNERKKEKIKKDETNIKSNCYINLENERIETETDNINSINTDFDNIK